MASVTRRTRRKAPEDRATIHETLTTAMERLLAHGHSFTSLSVAVLAAEAGIGRSTFYTHFRDKGHLVHHLMQAVAAEIVLAGDPWFSSPETGTRDDLRKAIAGIAGVYRRHYAVMAAVLETASYDAEVKKLFDDMMTKLCATSRTMLKRLQASGQAPAQLGDETADALTWMVERCCHQVLQTRSTTKREKVIDSLTTIIWRTFIG